MNTTKSDLILASGSPRRVELLGRLGLSFTVIVSGVGEEVDDAIDPAEMVVHLAERKARAVAAQLEDGIVVGADTTVVIDGMVLNKPADAAEAHSMLRQLRGRRHSVWTGVAVINVVAGEMTSAAIESFVTMRNYSDTEIDEYVATGEPLDKAGAYAIQGGAGIFVERIDGCYFNVVGLPLCDLTRQLAVHGVKPTSADLVCQLANGMACPLL